MAVIYPDPITSDTESMAERTLYQRFKEKLGNDYVVLHSVLLPPQKKYRGAGSEIDFLIAHPNHGVLVVEVKGGRISTDRGGWFSEDFYGNQHDIKDPAAQANSNVHSLLKYLMQHKLTRNHSYPVYYAVAFPEGFVSSDDDMSPGLPRETVIDETQLQNLEAKIESIFTYWKACFPPKKAPGRPGILTLVDALMPKREIRSRLSHQFETEAEQIKQLTENQYAVLRGLQLQRRAIIIGGAGTGKTMLALEKAKQLSQTGQKVLLLCFNRNLANWLIGVTEGEDITVSTYHNLTSLLSTNKSGRVRQHYSDFREDAANKLYDTLTGIQGSPVERERKLFDAVIVDEGQDFDELAWLTIDQLLKDTEEGVLYVFCDDNQNIYSQLENIKLPVSSEPYVLTDNLRNTQQIFDHVSQYSHENFQTICVGPAGQPVEIIPVESVIDAHKTLQKRIVRLVEQEGVPLAHIIVLTPRSEEKSMWGNHSKLGNYTLNWDVDAVGKNVVQVSTIHGFKGLERPVVLLTELDHAFYERQDQIFYIGMSRARNLLIILGELPSVTQR